MNITMCNTYNPVSWTSSSSRIPLGTSESSLKLFRRTISCSGEARTNFLVRLGPESDDPAGSDEGTEEGGIEQQD